MKKVKVYASSPLREPLTYAVPDELEDKVVFGRRVEVPLGSSIRVGFVAPDPPDDDDIPLKNVIRVIDKEDSYTRDLFDTALWMEKMYLSPTAVNLAQMIPSAVREAKASPSPTKPFVPIEKLTEEQEKALSRLEESDGGEFYIYGSTGSGKTEVYMRRAESVVRNGKQVLYLVPEISLTTELTDAAMERFGGRVAILHSSLTPSERLREWHRIIRGEAVIAIGARSAVFAPFCNLGLIVIDEEHDPSYKAGQAPRYHARQVAEFRAKKWGAQLAMGSATPSLEAWSAMEKGRIKRISMPSRIGKGAFPKTEVVSVNGENRAIGKVLEDAIRDALERKRGVILFLNRRGYAYSYACAQCGHVVECPNCSIPLTYHKGMRRLLCHTCGASFPLVSSCPKCLSRDLYPCGYGSESAEEEARLLFPAARIKRMDRDAADEAKGALRETLDAFRNGEIDILIGTQMIAKGLNFPSVSLVGILNADSSLFLPDFRAGERTFALIRQVSGRAGRYSPDGRVIIQTRHPDLPAISYAASGDAESFYEKEIDERRKAFFPPFSRLVNLTVRGFSEEAVAREAKKIEEAAREEAASFPGVEILFSSPCIIEKKAKQHRYHVLLRAPSASPLLAIARKIQEKTKIGRGMHLEIDVDPLDLM